MTEAQCCRDMAVKAMNNLIFWFNRLGYDEILRRLMKCDVIENESLPKLLKTGNLNDLNGAGVCVDHRNARNYVIMQMNKLLNVDV